MEEEIRNIIRTFETVGPLDGNAFKSGQLNEHMGKYNLEDQDWRQENPWYNDE